MRNFFIFIYRSHVYLIFGLLEIYSLYLVIQHNNYQKVKFLNYSYEVTGRIYNTVDNITKYLSLDKANEQLVKENAQLHTLDLSSFEIIDKNIYQKNDTIYKQKYEYISAKVINYTTNKIKNYITLNKGKNSGIEENMAVISPDGIVGIVNGVSDNYASVISLLNNKISISVKIKGTDHTGSLIWEGYDPTIAKVTQISSHSKVKLNDTIVTSGISIIFPEGINVGKVISINKIIGSNSLDIKIRLATDFTNIHYVYVIRNILKKEQKELELKKQND